jgi:enoyl-CoA hydratase/carnithine racemase
VGVLRATEALAVPAGLVVESLAYSMLLAGPEFARWLEARGPRTPPPAGDEPVLLARHDDELVVTLNRPARHNAYAAAVRDALVDALEVGLADTSLHVRLRGAGRSFCSGGDLDEFGTTPDVATAHLIRTTRSAGRLLHALGHRLTVEAHGACVGAGTELSAFGARVLARDDAWFQLPEVAMGLVPGAGGTVSVTKRIGRHRTAWLALTGARLDVAAALAWGLVDERC